MEHIADKMHLKESSTMDALVLSWLESGQTHSILIPYETILAKISTYTVRAVQHLECNAIIGSLRERVVNLEKQLDAARWPE